MASTYTGPIPRAERRLRRMEGPVNLKRQALGGDRVALDFELGFPEGRKAEVPDYRRMGTENTAIIVDDEGDVHDFQMRLGSVPQRDVREQVVKGWVESIVTRAGTHGEYGVMIADDRTAYTPHINWDPVASPRMDVDQAVDDLDGIWSIYKERVRDHPDDLPKP